MQKPVVGSFRDGLGEFYSDDTYERRMIFMRNRFFDIKPESSRFEQAFSADGGRTREANWAINFRRKGPMKRKALREDEAEAVERPDVAYQAETAGNDCKTTARILADLITSSARPPYPNAGRGIPG